MKMICLSNYAVLSFFTTCTFTVINAIYEDMRSETFQKRCSTGILQTAKTTDVYSRSLFSCAGMCLSDPRCCVASYSKGTSTCRIDTSEECCVETEFVHGWNFIQRTSYLSVPITCTRYIQLRNSLYSIHEDHLDWMEAKENCECLGGKLAELETMQENDFIKSEVQTRNTGVPGYWIGGYNFHNDYDMEWVGQPNQTMPFSDMGPGQPDYPMDELCMLMWAGFGFQWGDYPCDRLLSYICEFMHR